MTLEADLAAVISRFHREQQGHVPERVEALIVGDLIIVRCHSVFTRTEKDLAATAGGKKVIQSARRDQRALTRRQEEAQVGAVVGRRILRSFYDIDTRNGEQIEIYVMEYPLAGH